jgi:hypothetical protein
MGQWATQQIVPRIIPRIIQEIAQRLTWGIGLGVVQGMRQRAGCLQRLGCLCLSVVLISGLMWGWFPAAAEAAIAQPDRIPLTLDLLQERVKNPLQTEGIRIIDLSRFSIDLRPENAALRDQFYTLVPALLRKPGNPTGLDLSYSQIQGDFKISQVGVRAPLYGDSLSPIFTPAEQERLKRDRILLSQLSTLSQSLLSPNAASPSTPLQITVFRGPLKLIQTQFLGPADFSNTFFLNRLEAQSAQFTQGGDYFQSRFSQTASFSGAVFGREARFRSSLFFGKAEFNQVQFQGDVNFQSSEFQTTANFNQASFARGANFTRIQWQGNADFAAARWQDAVAFTRSNFGQSLFFPDATFERVALFREVQFARPVNLRGAAFLERADFGYTSFAKGAYLNIPGLKFDSDRAKIVGNPGQISKVLSVPTLQGNENLLRELVRNFRKLEQIPDANYLEFARERLRLKEIGQQLFGVNVNTANAVRLGQIGFSENQAQSILQRRVQQPFRSPAEVLNLDSVDLATYISVRDRIVARDVVSPGREAVMVLAMASSWVGLNLLLLLSRYGTDFWLIFGIGLVAIAYFGLLFWFVDRWRRVIPKPILPTVPESIWVTSCFCVVSFLGLVSIFRSADQPWWTLLCLAVLIIPVPTVLLVQLYSIGRFHDRLEESYFTEEGSLRQLRILIGRLPILPRFEMFRERYLPILWDRRWNWLNYFDFSLNNLLKFGFNDLRLRDEDVPGLVSGLVWYQWAIGLLYIALLLWTLSRTIPGLNVLIYFR